VFIWNSIKWRKKCIAHKAVCTVAYTSSPGHKYNTISVGKTKFTCLNLMPGSNSLTHPLQFMLKIIPLEMNIAACTGKYKKAQLTQRGTRESGACLKAHCEQIKAHRSSNWHWVRCIYIRQMAPPSRVNAAALEMCVTAQNRRKIHKTPIFVFKVIRGHWIQWQSRASVRLPISD